MHDKEKTKQVLETWGVQNVESAVRTLMDKKIISRVDDKNRTIPGRHYKMSEKWTNTLRPYTTGNLFGQGQAFREYLAEAFKNGKDILVSEMTNDGAVYCILNLLAAGKVRSLEYGGNVDVDCAQVDCEGVSDGEFDEYLPRKGIWFTYFKSVTDGQIRRNWSLG